MRRQNVIPQTDYVKFGSNENIIVDYSYLVSKNYPEDFQFDNCIVSFFRLSSPLSSRIYIDFEYFEKLDKQALEQFLEEIPDSDYIYISKDFQGFEPHQLVEKLKEYNLS